MGNYDGTQSFGLIGEAHEGFFRNQQIDIMLEA